MTFTHGPTFLSCPECPDPSAHGPVDCGHVCCDERGDPFHGHFLTPADCTLCAAARVSARNESRSRSTRRRVS